MIGIVLDKSKQIAALLKPSRSSAISSYLEDKLINLGQKVSNISVRNLPSENLVHANFNSPEIKRVLSLIEQARAMIFVSPVYKASYTGVLKAFIDLIPEKGLADKITLPITTGGSIAHLLSLEYAFKPLFSILGSQEIFNGIYFVDSQTSYQDNERTFYDLDVEKRVNTALQKIVDRLSEKNQNVQ
ncbi:NADPH-dependent FMN reductase [Bacillus gobiensis]|uniref:NADPH-dependent FMN reductase n=1 Tax=Bacillus gobiensis TaxID=1441095 RepID=UPI003D1F8F02